jgi:hypothetical protein
MSTVRRCSPWAWRLSDCWPRELAGGRGSTTRPRSIERVPVPAAGE